MVLSSSCISVQMRFEPWRRFGRYRLRQVVFHGLVFASVGPIIDIRLVSSINWLSSQGSELFRFTSSTESLGTAPTALRGQLGLAAGSRRRRDAGIGCVLGTACLLGSPCALKPCCISRKALGVRSALSRYGPWLLPAPSHFTLFSGWLVLSRPGRSAAGDFTSAGYASFKAACVAALSMVKSATNAVFSEVNLLEPFGLFRTVALAWTEGLNT